MCANNDSNNIKLKVAYYSAYYRI